MGQGREKPLAIDLHMDALQNAWFHVRKMIIQKGQNDQKMDLIFFINMLKGKSDYSHTCELYQPYFNLE